MIKSLKLSALALVMSVMTFQAQALNHAAGGFDCNTCNSKANSSEIGFLKSCGDCPGLEVGDIGNDVFHREKCDTMAGDKFTPACKQASKMLAKNLFAILEVAKLGVPGKPEAQSHAKGIVKLFKKLDAMNLGGKKGSSAPKDCEVCTSKGNVKDVTFLKGCGDCPGLESWDTGGAAFLKNNCKASSGKEFSPQCRHAAKMLSKGEYSVFTLAKTGKVEGSTAAPKVLKKAQGFAKNIVALIAKLDKMDIGEVGAAGHVSKHKAAPVAEEAAPAVEEAAPAPAAEEAAPAPAAEEAAPAPAAEEAPAE